MVHEGLRWALLLAESNGADHSRCTPSRLLMMHQQRPQLRVVSAACSGGAMAMWHGSACWTVCEQELARKRADMKIECSTVLSCSLSLAQLAHCSQICKSSCSK